MTLLHRRTLIASAALLIAGGARAAPASAHPTSPCPTPAATIAAGKPVATPMSRAYGCGIKYKSAA